MNRFARRHGFTLIELLVVIAIIALLLSLLLLCVAASAAMAADPAPLPRMVDVGADKCIPCKKMAPILVELRADWRYNGVPVIQASGKAQPERVDSTEIGYLGEFKKYGITLDVRAFEEKVSDLLRYEKACKTCPNDLLNKDANTQQGWEAQLRWQPLPATQILLNHTELQLKPDASSTAPQDEFRAPGHFSTLALFQKLPSDWDISLIYTSTASLFWVRQSDPTPAFSQTDIRLARSFRIGATRAEAALTVRAVDGAHVEFVETGYPAMVMDRRAVATLRLDF